MSSLRGKRRRAMKIAARAAILARREPRLQGKKRRTVALYAISQSRPLLEKIARHLFLVLRHKTYVFLYCAYAGHPIRGFMHDWSKFSPVEFSESVKYFNGHSSPVGLCRMVEGCSRGWIHHKGRNQHHHEYWQDVVEPDGTICAVQYAFRPVPMPFECAVEMTCDTIAASRAYNGANFSYDKLMQWWHNSHRFPVNMHPKTERYCNLIYAELQREGTCRPLRRAREFYDQAMRGE